MQVHAPGSGLPATITPSTALRQINATPQLVMPATMVATILTSFPVPATGETFSGELQLNHTQELLTYLSNTPLKIGEVLNLQATGPQSFRIIEPEVSAQTPQQAATQALRDLLPQYQPEALSQMIEELSTLASTTAQDAPVALQQQAQALVPFIPILDQSRRAEQLKTWIEAVQVPVEQFLAKGQLPSASSLPARLQQLLESINALPNPQSDTSSEQQNVRPSAPWPRSATFSGSDQLLVYQLKKGGSPDRSPQSVSPAPASTDLSLEAITEIDSELQQSAAAPPSAKQALPLPTHEPLAPGIAIPSPETPRTASTPTPLGSLLNNLGDHIRSFFVDQNLHRALEVLQQSTGQSPGILHHTMPAQAQNILFSAQVPFFFHQQPQSVFIQIGQQNPKEGGPTSPSARQEKVWQINLEFRLENLGTLLVRSNLSQSTIDTDFWAEQQKTLVDVQAHIPKLKEQLQQYGILFRTVHMHLGLPEQDATPSPIRLVDTKA